MSSSSGARREAAVLSASICAAVVTGQFVAGKAARDALYLANLPVTSLPAMVVATSACSILLAVASARVLRRLSPAAFVPAAFAAAALLLIAEWIALAFAPTLVARVVYLQVSGLGPMLGSGFWLIASECFDPRTAKRRFGQIAAAGTLGGLAGGLLAERVAAVAGLSTMLPVLAVMNGIAAWQIRQLGKQIDSQTASRRISETPELSPEAPRSGLRALAKASYLRDLAALVALGTLGAALADYAFRAQAAAVLGNGESLLRFFAIYYGAISLVTFVVQASLSRMALEKLGLGATASTPSAALLVGGIGSLLAPGLPSLIAARGGESAFRGSLFRASYELLYTPIPPQEKRAAKSIIDVGFDRLGDAVGAGAVWVVLLVISPARQTAAILWLAIVVSAGALALATRLNRGYVQTLERSLMSRAVDLDVADILDTTTRTTMLRTLSSLRRAGQPPRAEPRDRVVDIHRTDGELLEIEALRSRDRERILSVLHGGSDLTAPLIPHVIPLLAWDAVASIAVDALRRVAEEHVGAFTDALVNPNNDFAIRRRLARVFSVCVSQRAVDGLLAGLDDKRFEVRFHCARSLALIFEKNPRVRIDRERVFDVVLAEVAVGRRVWDGHRLLQELDDHDERFFADEFVKERASRSLSHVFTLLSLVLPAEPLQIAYRGLHTEDDNLRGTALEYLESVLPRAIRYGLWPYLEERPGPSERTARPREEILADLMRSHDSIAISLEAIRRKGDKPWQTT
jgi:ATP:ADP antiporter, AAA family